MGEVFSHGMSLHACVQVPHAQLEFRKAPSFPQL
jgi:hypothetical protein